MNAQIILRRYSPTTLSCTALTLQWLACRDYRPNEVLDAYEEEGIDEAPDAEDVTLEEQLAARARAERELNKRDRRENRRGLPGALEGGQFCTSRLQNCEQRFRIADRSDYHLCLCRVRQRRERQATS